MIFKTKQNTYCHLLWDSVFIDDKGWVFICCHAKPETIGNIYKDDLKTIWTQSKKLKKLRLKSLKGSLECFTGCNILSKEEKQGTTDYPVHENYPRQVWLLYGEFCNLNCIMCGQNSRSKDKLDNDILKKHIDWAQVESIELQGGEILAMKEAKELYLWLTREMNKKVNLITNGLLINDEWAEFLVRGSNWITISVNAATKKTHELVNKGSVFEKVIDNTKKLINLKEKYNLNTKIIFHHTTVKENLHELADAIYLANALGCDSINFGFDKHVLPFLKKNPALKEKIKQKISFVMNEGLKIDCETNRLEHMGLL
jgi:MoaA/NifB/PqqE/SkfB family radical SAM enzyme